jgi:predicted secreted Zn-dependent protease
MSEETLEIIIEALIDYRMWFKHEEEDDELSKIKLRQIEKALREIKKLK